MWLHIYYKSRTSRNISYRMSLILKAAVVSCLFGQGFQELAVIALDALKLTAFCLSQGGRDSGRRLAPLRFLRKSAFGKVTQVQLVLCRHESAEGIHASASTRSLHSLAPTSERSHNVGGIIRIFIWYSRSSSRYCRHVREREFRTMIEYHHPPKALARTDAVVARAPASTLLGARYSAK